MTTKEKNKLIADTLKWCNSIRKEMGMKPLSKLPKGQREDPESCPCGEATGMAVGRAYYYPDSDTADEDFGDRGFGAYGHLPESVMEFVSAFDFGQIPELDLHPEVE